MAIPNLPVPVDPRRRAVVASLMGEVPAASVSTEPDRVRMAQALFEDRSGVERGLNMMVERGMLTEEEAIRRLAGVPDEEEETNDGPATPPEYMPYPGESLPAQGLNRMLEQGMVNEETAAEIAGMPATPAELASRIGLARSFLDELPDLRASIAAGEATGPIDNFVGRVLGRGKSGHVFRRIATGQDALRRLLSGAALNQDEVSEYVARYSPRFFQDASDAVDAIDGLERDIRYGIQAASLGRGMEEILKQKGPPEGLRRNEPENEDDLLKALEQYLGE